MTEEKYDPPCCPAEKTIEEEKCKACVSALTKVQNEVWRRIKEYAEENIAPRDWRFGLYIAKLGDILFKVYEELKKELCESEVPPSPEDAKKKMLITLAKRYEEKAEHKPSLKTRLIYLFNPEERRRAKAVRDFYRAMAKELYKMAERKA
jgi:hypothetical protein